MLKAALFDLDGTVYHGSRPVAGAVALIDQLRRTGIAVRFITNNSTVTRQSFAGKLEGMGIRARADEIVTSAVAAATLVRGRRVFVIGEEGLWEALNAEGAVEVQSRPEAVVVGLDRGTNYSRMAEAVRYILSGARFIGTNPDRLLIEDGGMTPGNGALLAALEFATGIRPEVVGKPNRRMVEMAMESVPATPDECVLIGDNLQTDIPAGQAAGVRTVLLLTGIATAEAAGQAAARPDWIAADYAELRRVLNGLRPNKDLTEPA